MSDSSAKPENILGTFASGAGLLGTALFFTGWIYRWAYFGFFQVRITSLNFPAQSFLFVPIQVFFGNSTAIVNTFRAFLLTAITIFLILWLFQVLEVWVRKQWKKTQSSAILTSIQRQPSRSDRLRQFFAQFSPIRSSSLRFLQALFKELIIVAGILAALFWSARIQGTADAWRDAGDETSTLPVVAVITPLEASALGRKLDDVFVSPPLNTFSIIGDKGLFDALRGREDNDTSNPEKPRVWRLLTQQGTRTYLFIGLPPDATRHLRPSVVEIDKDRWIILSPGVSN